MELGRRSEILNDFKSKARIRGKERGLLLLCSESVENIIDFRLP